MVSNNTEQSSEIKAMSGPIEQAYKFNFLLGETLTTRLYSATDLKTGKSANIWIYKEQLDLRAVKLQDLFEHLKNLKSINPAICNFESYGYDTDGKVFLIFSSNFDTNLVTPRGSFDEMVRRFYRAVRYASIIHQNKLFIGDISDKFFHLTSSGTVQFVGGLKAFSSNNHNLLAEMNPEDLHYVAPELVANTFSIKSDVYALGILGYKMLFTDNHLEVEYKEGLLRVEVDLSKLDIKPSLNELVRVLTIATDQQAEKRYNSASELMEALVPALGQHTKASSEYKNRYQRNEKDNTLPAVRIARQKRIKEESIREQKARKRKIKKLVTWSIITFIFVLVISILVIYRQYQAKEQEKLHSVTIPLSGGNPELSKSVAKIANFSSELKERIFEIQRLANSPDPLSYSLLASSAVNSVDPNIHSTSQAALLDKLRKANFPLVARQLSDWFGYSRVSNKSKLYRIVLASLDPSIPENRRKELLTEITQFDLNIATRLTTALFFDQNLEVDYKPLFKMQISDPYKIKFANKLSSLALVISHEKLRQIFATYVVKYANNLTKEDLNFLLPKAFQFDAALRSAILKQAVSQELLSPEANAFLSVASNNKFVNASLQKVLIKIAGGEFDYQDIQMLSDWRDPLAEELLIKAIFLKDDAGEKRRIFNLIANRELKTSPARSLAGFVKNFLNLQQVSYIDSFAVIALNSDYSDEKLLESIKVFKSVFPNPNFHEILIKESGERVRRLFANNYINELGLIQKVRLLHYPDSELKKLLIKNIDSNDVKVIELIKEAYAVEINPEIKQLYKDQFWFLEGKTQESQLIESKTIDKVY